jgi:hypothetical protein
MNSRLKTLLRRNKVKAPRNINKVGETCLIVISKIKEIEGTDDMTLKLKKIELQKLLALLLKM